MGFFDFLDSNNHVLAKIDGGKLLDRNNHVIGKITSIGDYAFKGCGLQEVISYIDNPFDIWISTFSDDTYETATLYVPVGTISKYKTKKG